MTVHCPPQTEGGSTTVEKIESTTEEGSSSTTVEGGSISSSIRRESNPETACMEQETKK
jgi:hypothetical protein